jgi:glycosyltransferase involved in cell wall biosynthesis
MNSICFVSNRFFRNTIGGAEIQTFLMAKGLAARGYAVSYASPDIGEQTTLEGVRLCRIKMHPGERYPRFEDFRSAVLGQLPDLLFQVGRTPLTRHTARYCADEGVPFIFRVSSEISCLRFREVRRVLREHPLRKSLNLVRTARALKQDWHTFQAMKQASLIIAQTRDQKRLLERAFAQEVVHFENLHEVPAEESIVKDDPPVVLWLASMKSVKRPRLFLELCNRLQGSACRIVMAGRMNDESFRGDVEAMAAAGRLEYIEDVSFERSNALLATARIFVLTSRHEGLPNTLIQAWLRRTPTISLGVDPDGMIQSNGLGACVRSVDQAAAEIRNLLGDPARCDAMGEAARRFAVERFGMETQIRRLDTIVTKTLQGAQAGEAGRSSDAVVQ